MQLVYKNKKGQATVEAALLLPLIFVIMLLLIEPAILLYDTLIMHNAAAQGCRVLITQTADISNTSIDNFIKQSLRSIPEFDYFHIHDSNNSYCSYTIKTNGNATTDECSVTITNLVKPLPIIGFTGQLLNLTTDGNFCLKVSATLKTQPDWA